MHKNSIVTIKTRPQLVRRRTIVNTQQSVKIVIKPSAGQVSNLNDFKNRKVKINLQQPQQQVPQVPENVAVSKQSISKCNRRSVKKQPKVKYITSDVSPDSVLRIKQLRNYGVGKLLVIIGNGPSINEIKLEDLVGNPRIHTLSINKPDPRIWPTTHWAFFDQSQLRRHEDLWNSYAGFVFNSTGIKKQKNTSVQFKNLGGRGFSRDLNKGLHIGRSSVFAAMQIGFWLNYDHIYVLGCDMNPDGKNGKLHFYGVNPDVNPDIRKERFQKEAEFYDYAADVLDDGERQKFTFCSSDNPWGFVNKFNRLPHEIAIQTILTSAGS